PDAGKKDVDSIELELAPTAVLAVHAQDSDGKPVADATLRVEPEFEPLGIGGGGHCMHFGDRPEVLRLLEGKSDANGDGRFEHLPVGNAGAAKYDVVAFAKGMSLAFTDGVVVTKRQDASATLVLQRYRAATISGTVREKGGGALAGAVLRIDNVERARTDAD